MNLGSWLPIYVYQNKPTFFIFHHVYRLTSIDCEHVNSFIMVFQDHFVVVGSVCYLYFRFMDMLLC